MSDGTMTGPQRDQPILVNRRARSAMDKSVILVFALLGAAAIVVLKIHSFPLLLRVGVPCALMMLYACLTLMRTRFRLRYDQAGDNCYYLGFIYTLMSLAVTLYLIQGTVTGGSQVINVIRDFGVALSTTLVGIVLRVFLNQLREDPADIEEAIHNELFDQSQKLSGHIRAAVVAFDDMRNETADKLKNYVYAMEQVVNEHQTRVVELRDATTKLAKSVEQLASDLSAAEIPTGRLREAAAGTVAALQGARAAMAEVESGGKALVTQFASVGNAMESASGRSAAFAVAAGEVTSAAQSTSRALASLGEASETTASRVRSVGEGIELARREMDTVAQSVSAAANDHAAAVARAADSMRASATAIDMAASSATARIQQLEKIERRHVDGYADQRANGA